jgi:hypothetical protein
MKYHVHASDGDIGHVGGLLVDDETWAIRYLIVNTSTWWLGHQVLVAPQWIQNVSWFASSSLLVSAAMGSTFLRAFITARRMESRRNSGFMVILLQEDARGVQCASVC